jgi:hypothetical protein
MYLHALVDRPPARLLHAARLLGHRRAVRRPQAPEPADDARPPEHPEGRERHRAAALCRARGGADLRPLPGRAEPGLPRRGARACGPRPDRRPGVRRPETGEPRRAPHLHVHGLPLPRAHKLRGRKQLGNAAERRAPRLVGLGCGAAIPTLRAASHFLAAEPGATVACVAVEVCSAAFYLDDDPGVIISACLFSDGAAATLWRGSPGPGAIRAASASKLAPPAGRARQAPLRAARGQAAQPPRPRGAGAGRRRRRPASGRERGSRPVSRVVAHPGGRDVLEALAPVVAPHSSRPAPGPCAPAAT